MAYLAGTWAKKWWCPRVTGNTWGLYMDSDHAGEKKLYSQSRTGVAFFLNGFSTHWKSKKPPSTSLSSAAAEIYALSGACKDARLRYWISEDMGYVEQWRAVIKVDNAAAISFQQATKTNRKLKGVYNLRDKWVQELHNDSNIVTEKVCTTLNPSGLLRPGV